MSPPKKPPPSKKEERLAKALRENLGRRKALTRAKRANAVEQPAAEPIRPADAGDDEAAS